MSSLNKVMLIGNLGRDPEVRNKQDGGKIVTISIATSQRWRDKHSGEKREKTEWHRVVIFQENIAEVAEKYLSKGDKCYIEGELQTRKWTDKENIERYTTEIVADQMQMLGGREGGGEGGGYGGGGGSYGDAPAQAPRQQAPRPAQAARPAAPAASSAANLADMDDDIPF